MKFIRLFLFLYISIILSSCSTEFDVTAPYKEIPVMYGIIDKGATVQYIKINKAYLNQEGNAYVAGSNLDSNLLPYPIEVKLYARFSGISTVDSVQLDTVHLPKSSGNFTTNNVFYKTPIGYKLKYILNGRDTLWATYEIVVRRVSDRKIITSATSKVIADFAFSGIQNEVKLYDRFKEIYLTHQFKWVGAVNGKRYSAYMRFKFREVNDLIGTSEDKYLDLPMFSDIKTSNSNGSASFSYGLSGEYFFNFLQNNLDPLTESAARREYISPLEIYFNVAGEDLSLYMEINNSSGGLNDIKPEYTNVSNGLGIFSTRMNKVFNDVKKTNMSQDAIFELKNGKITGRDAGSNDLGFY